jgi:peptidoglycan-N-acetylglucosamine deacetylase
MLDSSPNPQRSEPLSARPWRLAPALRASLALHVLAAGAVVWRPHWWPWVLAGVIGDHLLLTGAGLWPRSQLLGPNLTHLPHAQDCVAITLDDGPDPQVTPAVLDMLARHQARATFFCVGERVAAHPQLARQIVARQHEIGNHSYRHSHTFSFMGPKALRADIERAQHSIAAASGATARFFRAPAGLRNPFLEPVLARANLRLASWTRRGFDTVSADATRVLGRLTHHLGAGDILLLHDGHAARTAGGTAVVLEVLPRLLDAVSAAGLKSVTLSEALAPSLREVNL